MDGCEPQTGTGTGSDNDELPETTTDALFAAWGVPMDSSRGRKRTKGVLGIDSEVPLPPAGVQFLHLLSDVSNIASSLPSGEAQMLAVEQLVFPLLNWLPSAVEDVLQCIIETTAHDMEPPTPTVWRVLCGVANAIAAAKSRLEDMETEAFPL